MNSQRVCDFMSRDVCNRNFGNRQMNKIIVYPQNDAKELAKIMADIRIEALPVFFSPWNRRPIGVIEFNKLRVLLND